MATRNIVPRANNEGQLGTVSKYWANIYSTLATITTATLSAINGNPTFGAGSSSAPSLSITNGTVQTSPTANAIENDGVAFYGTEDTTNGRGMFDRSHFFRLTSNGSGITTISDFFGANSAIPLVANSVYEIEWFCYLVQNTGAGTHTWTLTTSTNTITTLLSAEYITNPIAGIGTVGTPQTAGVINASGTTLVQGLPVTGSMAAANHYARIKTVISVGATGGNIRLRLTVSANNATPQAMSYYKVKRLPAGNAGTFAA